MRLRDRFFLGEYALFMFLALAVALRLSRIVGLHATANLNINLEA